MKTEKGTHTDSGVVQAHSLECRHRNVTVSALLSYTKPKPPLPLSKVDNVMCEAKGLCSLQNTGLNYSSTIIVSDLHRPLRYHISSITLKAKCRLPH